MINTGTVPGVSDVSPTADRLVRGGRPRDPSRDGAIRAAILEVLGRSGYSGLTMDAVAAAAGVGKATIYRRYRSKDQLVTGAVGALVDEQIEIPDTGSLRQDLLVLMREAVDLYGGGTLAAKLMPSVVDEIRRNDELAAIARDRFLTRRRAALGVVFERGVERGDLRPDIDVDFALDVLAGPLFYRLLITGGPIDDRLAQAVVELIVRAFAPAPKHGPEPSKKKDSR
jgi:AcrR family transcriptional regulator